MDENSCIYINLLYYTSYFVFILLSGIVKEIQEQLHVQFAWKTFKHQLPVSLIVLQMTVQLKINSELHVYKTNHPGILKFVCYA